MADSDIRIIQDAANADIRKIKQAIAKLEDSQNSVSRLKSASSAMRGQTGQAITEQAEKLSAQIMELIGQLNSSIKTINNTVLWYQAQDRAAAQGIVRGSGGI